MKEFVHECHFCMYELSELPDADRALINEAKKATYRSYSPYSHFSVGAAALLANGTIVTGCNQENAAFPSGQCAERTTLFYANAQYPDTPVSALAVAARDTEGFTAQPTPPCGACRQVILETEMRYRQPIRIILYGTEGTCIVERGVKDLLPLLFDASFLK